METPAGLAFLAGAPKIVEDAFLPGPSTVGGESGRSGQSHFCASSTEISRLPPGAASGGLPPFRDNAEYQGDRRRCPEPRRPGKLPRGRQGRGELGV